MDDESSAVRLRSPGQQRLRNGQFLQDQLGFEGAQIGKEGPGGQKDDGADDPTVKRPEAADDHHQQDVEHDRHAEGGLGVHVANTPMGPATAESVRAIGWP